MHFPAHLVQVMSSMRFLVQPQTLPSSSSRHSTHPRSRTPPNIAKLPMTRRQLYIVSLLVIISLSRQDTNCLELTHLKEQQEYSLNLNDSTSAAIVEQTYSSDLTATTKSDELYSSPSLSSSSSSSSSDSNSNLNANSHDEPLRPFYNIAHMVNSIREIKYYLSKGANAIEADVTFSPNGTALYTFHGYPCDCFRHCTEREDIIDYLKYIRSITVPGKLSYSISFTFQ